MAIFQTFNNIAEEIRIYDTLQRQYGEFAVNAMEHLSNTNYLRFEYDLNLVTDEQIRTALISQDILTVLSNNVEINTTEINENPSGLQIAAITCVEFPVNFFAQVFKITTNGTIPELDSDSNIVLHDIDDGIFEFSSTEVGNFEIHIYDKLSTATGRIVIGVV